MKPEDEASRCTCLHGTTKQAFSRGHSTPDPEFIGQEPVRTPVLVRNARGDWPIWQRDSISVLTLPISQSLTAALCVEI